MPMEEFTKAPLKIIKKSALVICSFQSVKTLKKLANLQFTVNIKQGSKMVSQLFHLQKAPFGPPIQRINSTAFRSWPTTKSPSSNLAPLARLSTRWRPSLSGMACLM